MRVIALQIAEQRNTNKATEVGLQEPFICNLQPPVPETEVLKT